MARIRENFGSFRFSAADPRELGETDDVFVREETPFVLGILADLHSGATVARTPLDQRRWYEIDRDQLPLLLDRLAPRLTLEVPNRFTDTGLPLRIELCFRCWDDWEPAGIAEQTPLLRSALQLRHELDQRRPQFQSIADLDRFIDLAIAQSPALAGLRSSPEASKSKSTTAPSAAAEVTPSVRDPAQLLASLLGEEAPPVVAAKPEPSLVDDLIREALRGTRTTSTTISQAVDETIRTIDRRLSWQLDEILHHPDFQRLEATWRGLRYLVKHAETGSDLKLRLLDLQRDELRDNAGLTRLLYDPIWARSGATPCGIFLADFVFDPTQAEEVKLLASLGRLMAKVQAPLVAAVAPALFGATSFAERSPEALLVTCPQWHELRQAPESSFLALILPRVLVRVPYGRDSRQVEAFDYEETIRATVPTQGYNWGSAIWALAVHVARAFRLQGWFLPMTGPERGRVESLPMHLFRGRDGTEWVGPVEVRLLTNDAYQLATQGIIPLVGSTSDWAAFLDLPMLRQVEEDSPEALVHRIDTQLCVGRFAQMLLTEAASRFQPGMDVAAYTEWLNQWLARYVGQPATAERPLSEATAELQRSESTQHPWKIVAELRLGYQAGRPGPLFHLEIDLP